jgi:hypothetical protein
MAEEAAVVNGTAAAGTVTPPATPKPAKVTGKLTMIVEYTGDVDESKTHAKSIVDAVRGSGLTVKAEFAETVPSKRAL